MDDTQRQWQPDLLIPQKIAFFGAAHHTAVLAFLGRLIDHMFTHF
jgi:hypothetical protein